VAARASGVPVDVRCTHPTGWYESSQRSPVLATDGDVLARAQVRREEILQSFGMVRSLLKSLPFGPARAPSAALQPLSLAVGLVEGWRGQVTHVALTDAAGRLDHYQIVDPSFHNWSGLAAAMRGQQISDFPLCNKSFNLSYCGFDL
jgi:Ni,Fe-hydrogenase III large subunit